MEVEWDIWCKTKHGEFRSRSADKVAEAVNNLLEGRPGILKGKKKALIHTRSVKIQIFYRDTKQNREVLIHATNNHRGLACVLRNCYC